MKYKILFAEDTEMHKKFFKESIASVMKELNIEIELVAEGSSGKELFELYSQHIDQGIDLIFSDIRMPDLDGLSALVKIKNLNPEQKMIMVSSETAEKIKSLNVVHGDSDKASAEDQKKLELLEKVAERIIAGNFQEGKVNKILDGCEKLAFDPVVAAKHFKANGYVQKPYNFQRMLKMFKHINENKEFILVDQDE